MDPQAPNIPAPEIPQVIQPSNHSNNITIISMAIFVLLSLGAVAFLYYQNQQLKSMLVSYQATPTPFVSPKPSAEAETADWKIYTNASIGFSLKYPSDWDTPTVNAQQISFDKILTIASKTTTTLDQFVTKNLPTDKTPAVDYINGGLRGKKLIYKSGVDQATVDTVIAFQGQTKNVITFSYTDSPGHITKSETINQILSTFKFIETSPSSSPSASPTSY